MEREDYSVGIQSDDDLKRYEERLEQLNKQISDLKSSPSNDSDWRYMNILWTENEANKISDKIYNYKYLASKCLKETI